MSKNSYVVKLDSGIDFVFKFNIGNLIKVGDALGEDPIPYVLNGVPNEKLNAFGSAVIKGCGNGTIPDDLPNEAFISVIHSFIRSFLTEEARAKENGKEADTQLAASDTQ
jgi:hypothetical protein